MSSIALLIGMERAATTLRSSPETLPGSTYRWVITGQVAFHPFGPYFYKNNSITFL